MLRVTGRISDLLNGIMSNTLDAPQTAFLTPKGKVIATADQLAVNPTEHLLLVEPFAVERFLASVDRFVKLVGAIIEATDWQVYFDLEGTTAKQDDEHLIPQPKGQLLLTPHQKKAPVTEEAFRRFRLEANLPEHGIDYNDELLSTINEARYVSFTKGCYIGQEIVARIHYRSKPPFLLKVKSISDCTEEEAMRMTSRTPVNETGEIAGFVFVKN